MRVDLIATQDSSRAPEANKLSKVTQEMVCKVQAMLLAGEQVALEYEHFFAPGVYCRVMHAPAGCIVVGKPHRTDHISMLIKGAITVTNEDNSMTYIEAPAIAVVPAGKKKMAFVHEAMSFVNVHPTEKTDIDDIEKDVIVPEEEFQQSLALDTVSDEEVRQCLGVL